ncbi:MAG: phosphatidylserine decarboxylase [bacterium]|nr:phosphatidylserine decarboxylase [bacterium]
MKIQTISARSALVLAICVVLVSPSLGASEAPDYKQDVPEALRSLVTAGQYNEIHSKLKETSCDVVDEELILRIISSPCGRSLAYLVHQYCVNPAVPKALNAVVAGLQDPPPAYGIVNPWKGASNGGELLRLMVDDFADWCVFLPEINGAQDNGLGYIQRFAWFYYHNEAGRDFVRGRDPLKPGIPLKAGLKFVEDFNHQRGKYMWSPASTEYIEQWINDPRIEIEDYQRTKADEYTSFNDFFARDITVDVETETIPSRPATMPLSEYPKRDYIVVSPTDCIMNPLVQVLIEELTVTRRVIENPLQYDTVLDVKGIPISLADLLEGVPEKYRKTFVGGTGLSCVLMPNTYHHFHSPVNGTIVHAAVLEQYGTFGYVDWPNWVPTDGNVGRPGTDFSQFQVFERGVIVIEVKYANLPEGQRPKKEPAELTGYVASIPVGLDTIGSVVLDPDIQPGKQVKRGYTRFGNFYYGGSLNILLFSEGLVSGAVQTRLGNQIGIINVGTAPESP